MLEFLRQLYYDCFRRLGLKKPKRPRQANLINLTKFRLGNLVGNLYTKKGRANVHAKSLPPILLVFCFFFTLFNFHIFSIGSSEIYLWQPAFLLFIAWGLTNNQSLVSLKVYGVFVLFLVASAWLGWRNLWLQSDLIKLALLSTGMLVYFNLFKDQKTFKFFILLASWLFIIAVIFHAKTNYPIIYLNSALVIACFGKGGGGIAWIAASFYILLLLVLSHSRPQGFSKKHDLCCILMLCLVLLTLTRAAILMIFIYCLITKKRRAIIHILIALPISLCVLFLAVQIQLLNPTSFKVLNGYRFFPFLHNQVTSTVRNNTNSIGTNAIGTKVIISISTKNSWLLSGRSLIWYGFLKYYSTASLSQKFLGFGIGSRTLSIKQAGFSARDPHNLFIDVLFNFGLVGVLALLFVILFSLVRFFREKNWESFAILAALLTAGLFNSLWRFSEAIWLTALIATVPYFYTRLYPLKASQKNTRGNKGNENCDHSSPRG